MSCYFNPEINKIIASCLRLTTKLRFFEEFMNWVEEMDMFIHKEYSFGNLHIWLIQTNNRVYKMHASLGRDQLSKSVLVSFAL